MIHQSVNKISMFATHYSTFELNLCKWKKREVYLVINLVGLNNDEQGSRFPRASESSLWRLRSLDRECLVRPPYTWNITIYYRNLSENAFVLPPLQIYLSYNLYYDVRGGQILFIFNRLRIYLACTSKNGFYFNERWLSTISLIGSASQTFIVIL